MRIRGAIQLAMGLVGGMWRCGCTRLRRTFSRGLASVRTIRPATGMPMPHSMCCVRRARGCLSMRRCTSGWSGVHAGRTMCVVKGDAKRMYMRMQTRRRTRVARGAETRITARMAPRRVSRQQTPVSQSVERRMRNRLAVNKGSRIPWRMMKGSAMRGAERMETHSFSISHTGRRQWVCSGDGTCMEPPMGRRRDTSLWKGDASVGGHTPAEECGKWEIQVAAPPTCTAHGDTQVKAG